MLRVCRFHRLLDGTFETFSFTIGSRPQRSYFSVLEAAVFGVGRELKALKGVHYLFSAHQELSLIHI